MKCTFTTQSELLVQGRSCGRSCRRYCCGGIAGCIVEAEMAKEEDEGEETMDDSNANEIEEMK